MKSIDLDNLKTSSKINLAVVIPAYRTEAHIAGVLSTIPKFIQHIIVVDDKSPDGLAAIVQKTAKKDKRIILVQHAVNKGVGGAVLTGYKKAIELGADIIIKMDSDGQMDPSRIESLLAPILERKADYTKGNRFLHETELKQMPFIRRFGNLGLSFLTKAASGYWNIFDPTNGFTAIYSPVINKINQSRIDKRYFFETSMLIELGLQRVVVKDVSIPAVYEGEISSLSIWRAVFEFPWKLINGTFRRFSYLYFLRDFTSVTIFLLFGGLLVFFGLIWGLIYWQKSAMTGIPASTGTVMIAVLPLMIGIQLLIQALGIDIQNVPNDPINLE